MLSFFGVHSGQAAAKSKTEENAKEIALHMLGNVELIKKGRILLQKAHSDFLAQLRGLYQSEMQFNTMKDDSYAVEIPVDKPKPKEEIDLLDVAKMKLDHIKHQAATLNKLKEHLKATQASLSTFRNQLMTAQNAGRALNDAYVKINTYILEIDLRLQDGTLTFDDIPNELHSDVIMARQQMLAGKQDELDWKSKTIQEEKNMIIVRLKEIDKKSVTTESQISSFENDYNHELKRRNIEKEFLSLDMDPLLTKFSTIKAEFGELKITLDFSIRQFRKSEKKTASTKEKLEELTVPDADKVSLANTLSRCEEAEQAIQAVEEIIKYQNQRLELLNKLRPSIKMLVEYGDLIEKEAPTLMGYLFKLQLMAGVIEMRIQTGQLPPDTPFPEYKIVEKFTQISTGLESKQKVLENTRKEYEEKQSAFNETRNTYESMQDPLLQKVKEDISDEKRHVKKMLHDFAGIEFSANNTNFQGEKKKNRGKATAGDNQTGGSGKEGLLVDLEFYQNLVSTRFELIDQRAKYESELSETLKTLDESINQFISKLIETWSAGQQRLKAALGLKLRLTQGKMRVEDIPPKLEETLKSDIVPELEKEIIRLYNSVLEEQLSAQQLLTNLMRPDETLDGIEKLNAQIAGFVGNRFDILKVYQNVKNKIAQKAGETGSETARKAFEQQAARRLSDEDTFTEFLLGLLPSSHPGSLIELMKAYYRELIDLETKKKYVDELRAKIGQLIQLSQEELSAADELIPLIRKHISYLETRYVEQLAKIRTRLNPESANDILKEFESESGYRFSIPTPVAKEKRIEFIETGANQLFDRKANITAVKRQLNILENRLSSDIHKEIDIYKHETDLLTIRDANIQRRIRFITGLSRDEAKNIPPENIPEKEIEKRRFLKGEIGMLRVDRMTLHRKEWIKLMFKLAAILVLAVVANWIVNRIVAGLKMRTEAQGKQTSQGLVLYSLCRTVSKFMIGVIAIVMGMYSMGINVAAILTGLGIGGLAIAMAAKETLANLIGGVTILMTHPFTVGSFIKYGKNNARVEDIGLRYTKLRERVTNALVIMPNSRLAETEVINVTDSLSKGIVEQATIPLSIRNTSETVMLACTLIKDIIDSHSRAELVWLKIGGFDNYAFELKVRYRILGMDMPGKRHEVIDEINASIIKQFKKRDIEFAVKPHRILTDVKGPETN